MYKRYEYEKMILARRLQYIEKYSQAYQMKLDEEFGAVTTLKMLLLEYDDVADFETFIATLIKIIKGTE